MLFGASLHAEVVLDVAVAQGHYEPVAALDPGITPGQLFSAFHIPVLGADNLLPILVREFPGLQGIIAVGDNRIRKTIAQFVGSLVPGFPWASLVHPSAVAGSNVSLGPGTVVMPGAVIQTGCRIGSHCLVNTMASLDHHSQLGDFVHLAPGVHTGGEVRIGEGVLAGIGAAILPRTHVPEWTVVKARLNEH
ncbi:MAG: acetyltransferase [Bacteroidia bacterium]